MSPNQWLFEVGMWAFTFAAAMVGAFFSWLASFVS